MRIVLKPYADESVHDPNNLMAVAPHSAHYFLFS